MRRYWCLAWGLGLLVALGSSGSVLAQSDTTPPALTGFDFNPKRIDVSPGQASVTCTISATDVPAGVDFVECKFLSPSLGQAAVCGGNFPPSSGDSHSGTWTCQATVPRFAEEGIWQIFTVRLEDAVGNGRILYRQDLQQAGYPTDLQVTSLQDVAPPSLTGFDFNPKSVDVSTDQATVSCTIGASDVPAGIDFVECKFLSPSGAQAAVCGGNFPPSSGDSYSGTWICQAAVPQFGEAGTWSVYTVRLEDAVGNGRTLYRQDLQQAGYPTDLQVTSQQDLVPPSLTSLDFNPKSVDVSTGAANVTCAIGASDVPAGVDFVECKFLSPSFGQAAVCGGSFPPSSGDSHSGTWTCQATVPQFGEEGTWSVYTVRLADAVGNGRILYRQDLQQSGFPTNLQVGFLAGAPAAVVTAPRAGKRIRGNSVTIRAELVRGTPADVSPTLGVRFEYRKLPSGSFAAIPAADSNHPNPDTTYPYFIHWDTSSVSNGDYQLRAIARDLSGSPDPAPAAIMITVDRSNNADLEEKVNTQGLQQATGRVLSSSDDGLQIGDRTGTGALVLISIPAGALTHASDQLTFVYPNPSGEISRLEQPGQNLEAFVDLSLQSGQQVWGGGATAGLEISYSDQNRDGIVDDTGVAAVDLEMRRYDAASGLYLTLPSTLMSQHNRVHCDITGLGRYALTGPMFLQEHFQADKATLIWTSVSTASSYNVYRGALASLIDQDHDGLPDAGYGTCQSSQDPDVTDTLFVDLELPSPAQGFFYLVAYVGVQGEEGLGRSSAGIQRTVSTSCP